MTRPNIGQNLSLLAGAMALSALSAPAEAKLLKFEVVAVQSPAFDGRLFGAVGAYDKITARATIGVDPTDPHDVGIADIDMAPRDAQGLVEATGDVVILRPHDAAKSNHHLFYEVNNRGRKLALMLLDDAPPGDGLSGAAAAGNGFLMDQGYTIVWSGWQGDIAPGQDRMSFSAPIVQGITGLSREEWIFDNLASPATAALSYPAAELDPRHARLTVREREADTRAIPKDLHFRFDGPDRIVIDRPAGFDAGAIYELIYRAKNPKVMGLGFAATRDIVAFLRFEARDGAGIANPLSDLHLDRAIALGISQSGRFLRDFIYQGFNEDEAGRTVFEGIMPHIGGGKRTFVNARWAQPGRHSEQHPETVYPGDQFPFTYPVLTDPLSGRTDGILRRCLAAGNCPKIIQSDTGTEFYESRAALVVTAPNGRPVDMPDNVRLFYLADLQHFALPGTTAMPNPICLAPTNPVHAGPAMRALLLAMDRWITTGAEPPASRYPSLRDGSLVSPEAAKAHFPVIPGFPYSGLINRPTLVDDRTMPPRKGIPYPAFVPKTDGDGMSVVGLKLPAIQVPVATYLGFNYRKAGFAEGELCDLFGSTLPFARTQAERTASGDPRPSLAERYADTAAYRVAVGAAAEHLVADRLMLPEDAERIEKAAVLPSAP